jgi:hypothetical protein
MGESGTNNSSVQGFSPRKMKFAGHPRGSPTEY